MGPPGLPGGGIIPGPLGGIPPGPGGGTPGWGGTVECIPTPGGGCIICGGPGKWCPGIPCPEPGGGGGGGPRDGPPCPECA